MRRVGFDCRAGIALLLYSKEGKEEGYRLEARTLRVRIRLSDYMTGPM